jgi:hypothetical protein
MVDADVLFNSTNEDKKAEELLKLLQIAGMDVTEDLSDTSLMETLQQVLANFDPNKKLKDEDQAFTMKLTKFNH